MIGPLRKCSDCGVAPGELHHPGCDVERCRLCGFQAIQGTCIRGLDSDRDDDYTEDEIADYDRRVEAAGGRLPWTGEWCGEAECREYGFWCYWGPDYGQHGWVRCEPDHPGAREDLNRLLVTCVWDAVRGRWVLPKPKN